MNRDDAVKALDAALTKMQKGGRYTPEDVDDLERCARDVLDLLKAQEPVEPKMMEFVDKGLTWEKYEVPTCGVCGALLGDAQFCPVCGREVKWDE